MAIEDEVLHLATIVPREPGVPLPTGAEDWQIDGFTRSEGVPIPDEVRHWLRFTDGPVIGPGGINGLKGFQEDYEIHPVFKEKLWLPLGTDGCGNYYVLALDSSDKPLQPVYFIDCIKGYDEPNHVVASGFWQFLRFLFQDELGDRRWPFQPEHVLGQDPDLARVKCAPLPWRLD
jgi:hypothetical protein